MSSAIGTRLLILSDTHGKTFEPINDPCDVVIHCGDLTDGSKLEEYRTTITCLSQLKAPLKLVIAGNHDFTMDSGAFEKKLQDAVQPLNPDLIAREYGITGQVRKMFEEAKDAGIMFLDEGTHHFSLANGAQMKVYASPYTPSMGQWGFQYHPNEGHNFDIEEDVDIAITHGPPKGIMDYTYGRERAGCLDLFAAIAHARPKIHCFGHIHEGWGARLVSWKDGIEQPTHFTAIDNDRSHVVQSLAGLRPSRFDTDDTTERRKASLERMKVDGCIKTDHRAKNQDHPMQIGKQTLFVNAAIEGVEDFEQRPWLVEVDLPEAQRSSS